jgi:hypothetical protein
MPAMAGLLFGFDIGATSGVVSSLTGASTSGTDWGPSLSAFQSGLLVGAESRACSRQSSKHAGTPQTCLHEAQCKPQSCSYLLTATVLLLQVGASLAGALTGSLGTLLAGNRIGRRTELLAAALLYGECAAPCNGGYSCGFDAAGAQQQDKMRVLGLDQNSHLTAF